ncbi:hypothetical protein [Aestuariivirga sp.]|uniref:hypothetical protein n=1 Tax=Aestuariivirga sp. TaxID=2650926 RepID=UPI003918ABF7
MSAQIVQTRLFDEVHGYWNGEGPLWKLFWVYGVLFSTFGGFVLMAGVMQRLLPAPVLLVLLGAALFYTAFILLSIWRSAFNIYSDPLGIEREAWGWLARVLTFGWAINAAAASLMLLQYTLNY